MHCVLETAIFIVHVIQMKKWNFIKAESSVIRTKCIMMCTNKKVRITLMC